MRADAICAATARRTHLTTAGDQPDVLVAMNPAALTVNSGDLKPGGILVANTGNFAAKDLKKAGLEENPLTDGTVSGYRVIEIDINERVAEALNQHKIVRPVLQRSGTSNPLNGHPVGFSRSYAWALIQCQGDEGARRLLADNPQDVYLLPLGDEGIVQDIDRPEDC